MALSDLFDPAARDQSRLQRQQATLQRAQSDPTASAGYVASVQGERDRLQQSVNAGAAVRAQDQAALASRRPQPTNIRYSPGQGASGLAPRPVMTAFAPPADSGAPAAAPAASAPAGPTGWRATMQATRAVPGAAAVTPVVGNLAPAPPRGGRVIRPGQSSAATAPLAPRPDFSDVSSRVLPRSAAAGTAAPATAGGGILHSTDSNGNSVYSDTAAGLAEGTMLANAGFGTGGARRLAPGTLTGASAALPNPRAAATASGATAGSDSVGLAARPAATVTAPAALAPAPVRGSQGAVIANPMDSTADKLQRAMMSASVKGSPSARAAIAQAILGEAQAGQSERAANLQAGREADQAAVQANLQAPEAAANRDLRAQEINADLADSAANRAAGLQEARLARRPTPITTVDGSMGLAGDEGRFTPITGTDGKPVKTAVPPRQTGGLTQADLLKSYDERYKAIASGMGTAEEKQAAYTALNNDPMYASLRGSTGGAAAGMQQVGTTPDGRPVYRDATGNQFVDE